MKPLLYFFFSDETTNYVRWRWRHNKASFFLIPLEWIVSLYKIRTSRESQEMLTVPLSELPAVLQPHFSNFYIQPNEVEAIADYARKTIPEQVASIMSQAREMTNGKIPLSTGYDVIFSNAGWRPSVNDQEHLFCLNRWAFGTILAKAWAYSREPQFARCFSNYLDNWIQSNPPTSGDPVWESYSVSERIVQWCFCSALLWNSPDFQKSTFPKLSDQLELHARWLLEHLETRVIHNHLINNARALYMMGSLFELESFRKLGKTILEREMARQVLPDGVLGEQSIPYHLLLTRTYVEAAILARQSKRELAAPCVDRLKLMIDASSKFLRADGSVPLVGDVSPDIPLSALRGMVGVGQIFFQFPVSEPLSESARWYVAPSIANKTPDIFSESMGPRSFYFPFTGFSGYQTNTLHLLVHSDPRGEVFRHGHADASSVSLWHAGQEILIDSGNFSYNYDKWWRYFRSSEGHNTLTIDGLPPYPVADFLAPLYAEDYRKATAELSEPQLIDRWWVCETRHTGYARIDPSLHIKRRIIAAPEYVWVTDWVKSKDSHNFEARWHWGTNAFKESGPGRWTMMYPKNKEVGVLLLRDHKAVSAEWPLGISTPSPQGWYSPDYGRKQVALASTIRGNYIGSNRLDLLVLFTEDTSKIEFMPESNGSAHIRHPLWNDEFHFGASQPKIHRETIRA